MGLADGQAWENQYGVEANSVEENIEEFIRFADNLVRNNTIDSKIISTKGRKYVKLIMCRKDESGKSSWCFVDKKTGDIFKSAGWNAPAKHSRGNVNDSSTYEHYQWTGPHYLR